MYINIFGLMEKINLSDEWHIEPINEDFPPNSTIIQKETEYSTCMVVIYPIEKNDTMLVCNPDEVINTTHNLINENQGIIEVKSGCENFPYIYTIIKTFMENEHMMQYILSLHMNISEKYYQVQGFFEEYGITGTRETAVLEQLRRKDIVKIDEKTGKLLGWFYDPYIPEFEKGILMNLSEQDGLDQYFPYHPLSEARHFVKEIISNKL